MHSYSLGQLIVVGCSGLVIGFLGAVFYVYWWAVREVENE